jgi:hypothetical protein
MGIGGERPAGAGPVYTSGPLGCNSKGVLPRALGWEPPARRWIGLFDLTESRHQIAPTLLAVSDSRGSTAERDARVLLTRLIAAKSSDLEAGDPSLLPEHLESEPLSRVSDQFGADFGQSLARVKPGQSGPLRSAYGYHLVFVTMLDPTHSPRFEDVRAAVQRQWFAENRAVALDAQYRKLLGGFQVRVDHPAQSGLQP